jgi:hypothetical protein
VEAMLKLIPKFANQAPCMVQHFEEMKIIDRFYSPGIEKNSSLMLQELEMFLPNAYNICIPSETDLLKRRSSNLVFSLMLAMLVGAMIIIVIIIIKNYKSVRSQNKQTKVLLPMLSLKSEVTC